MRWFKKKQKEEDTQGIVLSEVVPEGAGLDNHPDTDVKIPNAPELKQYDVSDCIEIVGWGWYHWKVEVTMGMMSFADSAEIWLISIISPDLVCEWGLSSLQKALIPGLVFFFMAIGSFISGILSDRYGRWKVMLIVYYIFTVAAVASAFAWDYYSFLVFRCTAGFCIGANYGVSICYSAEMVPIAKRGLNLMILDLMWAAGGVYICFMAFLVMQYEHGWRYLVLLGAAPCIITIFTLYLCDESVRYLAINDKPDEAKKVLDKMAESNGVEPIEGEVMCSQQEPGNVFDLFSKPLIRITITIMLLFMAVTWVFYGFMYLVPDMMADAYCHLSDFFATTYVNGSGCTVYTKAEYLFLIVFNLTYVPAYLISPLTSEKWGRKPTLWYSYWGSLAVTALFLICLDGIVIWIELVLAVNLYGIAIATIWLYMPECYPTYIRSTATGTQNGFSKLGAACGTFLTEYLDTFNVEYSIYMFLVVLGIACVASLFLQLETRGMSLKDDRDYYELQSGHLQNNRQSNYGSTPTGGIQESQLA